MLLSAHTAQKSFFWAQQNHHPAPPHANAIHNKAKRDLHRVVYTLNSRTKIHVYVYHLSEAELELEPAEAKHCLI